MTPEGRIERIREALHAWRDNWTEPHSWSDFTDDDIDEVMAVVGEIEGIVDEQDAAPEIAPATATERIAVREAQTFEDELWAGMEKPLVEVDRRPGPDTLIQTLALVAQSDVYASTAWIHWCAQFLTIHQAIDFEPAPLYSWDARVRAALKRDMIEPNGKVPDGPYEGSVRYCLTERGRIELARFETDRPRVVRYP